MTTYPPMTSAPSPDSEVPMPPASVRRPGFEEVTRAPVPPAPQRWSVVPPPDDDEEPPPPTRRLPRTEAASVSPAG